MKKGRTLALTTTVLALLAGCGFMGATEPDEPVAKAPEKPLEVRKNQDIKLPGTRWAAARIDAGPVAAVSPPTVEFVSATEVKGFTSCNTFFGSVEIIGRAIRFREGGRKLLGCAPQLADQEKRFLAAMGAVRSYRFDGERLVMLDDLKRERLALDQTVAQTSSPQAATRDDALNALPVKTRTPYEIGEP